MDGQIDSRQMYRQKMAGQTLNKWADGQTYIQTGPTGRQFNE